MRKFSKAEKRVAAIVAIAGAVVWVDIEANKPHYDSSVSCHAGSLALHPLGVIKDKSNKDGTETRVGFSVLEDKKDKKGNTISVGVLRAVVQASFSSEGLTTQAGVQAVESKPVYVAGQTATTSGRPTVAEMDALATKPYRSGGFSTEGASPYATAVLPLVSHSLHLQIQPQELGGPNKQEVKSYLVLGDCN